MHLSCVFRCFSSVQAMDMYYHNESDPDSYGWPGDNSKSTSLLFSFFLYFLLSSPSSLSVFHRSHSSVIPLLHPSTKSFRSFLFIISTFQCRIISSHSLPVYFSLVCYFLGLQSLWCAHTLCYLASPYHWAL